MFRRRKRTKLASSRKSWSWSKGSATISKWGFKTSRKRSFSYRTSMRPLSRKIGTPTLCSTSMNSECKKPWRNWRCFKYNCSKARSPTRNKSPDSRASSSKLKRNSMSFISSTRSTTTNRNTGEVAFHQPHFPHNRTSPRLSSLINSLTSSRVW